MIVACTVDRLLYHVIIITPEHLARSHFRLYVASGTFPIV